MSANLCECGCGTAVPRRFVRGHAMRTTKVRAASTAALLKHHGTADRNREIERRARAGERLCDIASDLGLSRQRIDQIINRQETIARHAIARAVERGILVRPAACERCNGTGDIEGHHADYSQPLAVEWLCTACHSAADQWRHYRRAVEVLNPDAGKLLLVVEAAKHLGVSVEHLGLLRRRGAVRGIRITGRLYGYRAADLDRARSALRSTRAPDICPKGHRMTPENTGRTKRGYWRCNACNAENVLLVTGRERRSMSMYATRQAVTLAGFRIIETGSHTIRAERGGTTLRMSRGGGSPWYVRLASGGVQESHRIASLARLAALLRTKSTSTEEAA